MCAGRQGSVRLSRLTPGEGWVTLLSLSSAPFRGSLVSNKLGLKTVSPMSCVPASTPVHRHLSSGNLAVLDFPSPNHGPRPIAHDGWPHAIDMLVLHYTGMRSAQEALDRMCDSAAQVSAHYMVDEDGTILQLVEENRRAWHAGVSCWHGDHDVNGRSIGIEIVNPGHEFGYRPFPDAQMASVIALCQDILQHNAGITPRGIVGHAEVAPERKEDPGELFDWQALARAGIGLFPSQDLVSRMSPDGDPEALLHAIGYPLGGGNSLQKTLVAFQRRYRPADLSGQADAETCRLLAAVAEGFERLSRD